MSVNVWDGSSIILCSLVDTCVCRSSRPFIYFFFFTFTDHHHHHFIDGKRKSRKLKSMFLLEYQWVQCACWWERRTHLIRVWIEMNKRNDFFWHVCLLEKINIWVFSFFFFLSTSESSYQKKWTKPTLLSVRDSFVRWITCKEIYIYIYIYAHFFSSLRQIILLIFFAYVCDYTYSIESKRNHLSGL
jgi:hypothetical protein